MHLDLRSLQLASIAVVFLLLFLSRRSRGRPRPSPAGLAFPLKPLVVFSRAIALPLYFLLFAYPLWISRQSIPPWLLLLLFVVLMFSLFQLPGTILLTPTALLQRFWLRPSKAIPYTAIASVTGSPSGAITRVSGHDGTTVTHTFNHVAPTEFRAELARLSGKPFTV